MISRRARGLAVALVAVAIVGIGGVLAYGRWGPAPVTAEGIELPSDYHPLVASPTPPASPSPSPSGAPTPEVATLLAAGDIGECGGEAAATGALLAAIDGTVAALGDVAYPDGSSESFAECFDPGWGAVRDRIRPTQGNHDVRTAGAAGYYGYFGAAAGPEPQGYYSYDLGSWHVVVLNSNCAQVGGCDRGSPQIQWLEADLAAATTGNILAYWHAPRFSTGYHRDYPAMATFWEVLHAAGADVVLNGHDHDYQRFAPLDPSGQRDPDGIREFVVGTGGGHLRDFAVERDTIDYRQNEAWGVLRLDLGACGYRWAFLPVGGGDPLDEGTTDGTC